jgi:hypothetical protein
LVGGTGVLVAGTAVGAGTFVGGTAVAVFVGSGVSVGSDVSVGVGEGSGVFVGKISTTAGGKTVGETGTAVSVATVGRSATASVVGSAESAVSALSRMTKTMATINSKIRIPKAPIKTLRSVLLFIYTPSLLTIRSKQVWFLCRPETED